MYIKSVVKQLTAFKRNAEDTFMQLSDEDFHWQYNEESNSIAVIMQHMWENMLSRWTDFLHSDGEKPWRHRDAEFEAPLESRTELLTKWNEGWDCCLQAISAIQEEDLNRIVYIRKEAHTVLDAINRQLAHYPYHIGQIVYIAKMRKDHAWKTLSIARNKTYKNQK